MLLRHALILALLASLVGTLVLAFDWDRRCVEAATRAFGGADRDGWEAVHRPYLMVLLSLAIVDLAVLLLLRSVFREERCAALRRARA